MYDKCVELDGKSSTTSAYPLLLAITLRLIGSQNW